MGIPYSLFGSYGGSKRPREESDDECEDFFRSPVRKKLKTTEYIYQQLFLNGEKSDVTILALGQEWNLHKVYLSQSQYFSSMFKGTWKESNQSIIDLNIPNKLITTKSLNQVFASLYRDEIEIEPSEVISLLATANLFQLESLTGQCAEVMCESLSVKTVVKFYHAAEQNGLVEVRDRCCSWMRKNLLNFVNNGAFLKNISLNLMKSLIVSNDLFVIQGEFDLYSLLKKWIFVRLNGYSKQTDGTLKKVTEDFFSSIENDQRSFLETVRGRRFLPIFACLRLSHILTSDKNVQTISNDNIIPKHVIESTMAVQWRMQLMMESAFEIREDKMAALNDEDFFRSAIRCGRILTRDAPNTWRWSGFYFGVDILLSYKNRMLSVKRNCGTHNCPYSINMKPERIIFFKLTVVQFDKQRRVVWSDSTSLERISMKPDDVDCKKVSVALKIPNNVGFPLTIAFWYSVTPADKKSTDLIQNYPDVWNKCKNITSLSSDSSSDDDSEDIVENK